MVNEFAHVTIIQDSKTGYKIKVTGTTINIIGGLAAAVALTIKSVPEDLQQEARVRFLRYLNEATNHAVEE